VEFSNRDTEPPANLPCDSEENH